MNVLIAGSSRGIGRKLVSHFIDRGDQVWGLARTTQKEMQHLPGFTPIFGNACAFDESPLPDHLDVLITCVGSQNPIGLAMECDPHEWIGGLRDNLFGVFNTIHVCYPRLLHKDTRRGKIICFSGGGATNARPYFSSYACSKCAVVRLVETLHEEWKQFDITIDINALAPGAIFTGMTRQVLSLPIEQTGQKEQEAARRTRDQNHEHAMLDVTGCIDWLASEKTDGISGKLIAAKWDEWRNPANADLFREPDRFTLRRTL